MTSRNSGHHGGSQSIFLFKYIYYNWDSAIVDAMFRRKLRHRERLIEKRFFPADSKQLHRWSGTPDLFPVDTHIRCSWFIHKDS